MVYEYECRRCLKRLEIIKPAADSSCDETCDFCKEPLHKIFSRAHLTGTKVQEKVWQPAIGKPATNSELATIAKRKGWEPIGNEKPEKHLRIQRTEYE